MTSDARRGLPRISAPAAVWLAWTAASTLGLFLGVRVVFGLLEGWHVPVQRGPWSATLDTAALGAGAGALFGACQALVLGRSLGGRGGLAWVAATAAGAGLALGLARGGDGLLRLVGLGVCSTPSTGESGGLWLWRSSGSASGPPNGSSYGV